MPEEGRAGAPERPFENLRDYVKAIASFRPVYVKRDGEPVLPRGYDSFEQYYNSAEANGKDVQGRARVLRPQPSDIDLHCTCYWFNARLSHYHTVENRVSDQQPPEDIICVSALTLGLASALPEACEELRSYDWGTLRECREAACRQALSGSVGQIGLPDMADRLLDIASLGLRRRDRGEERFLQPLAERVRLKKCPADHAARLFKDDGVSALIWDRSF